MNDQTAPVTAADGQAVAPPLKPSRERSLTRRMIVVAAFWITAFLLIGGFALDRILSAGIVRNFDDQLEYVLNAMVAASEIGPDGEVRFTRQPADQRFVEPYSGIYFQISGEGRTLSRRARSGTGASPSRTATRTSTSTSTTATSSTASRCAITERDVVLPGSKVRWRYQVAQSREMIDSQIRDLRSTLFWSFLALGVGLLILAALQTFYGLWPLRRVRQDVAAIRSGAKSRIAGDFPNEVRPLTEEINQLLAHSEEQAEEARRHAGNLAHALKTPLTVITNAATANAPDLADTVCREAIVMRRQVDHHLARARAIGRRASAQARSRVWESVDAVQRAVDRLYENVTVDIAGDKSAQVRVERQDLDEMIGNLVENAAKYGGGRVFVTVERKDGRSISSSKTTAAASRSSKARRSSSAAPGSTPTSPAPASASPSSATSPKSTAARSRSRRARTLAGCLRA